VLNQTEKFDRAYPEVIPEDYRKQVNEGWLRIALPELRRNTKIGLNLDRRLANHNASTFRQARFMSLFGYLAEKRKISPRTTRLNYQFRIGDVVKIHIHSLLSALKVTGR